MEINPQFAEFLREFEEGSQKLFYGSQFAIIAVECLKDNSVGQRKLSANKKYYLLNGYEIKHDNIIVCPEKMPHVDLYDDYVCTFETSPKITINAIVGENGSGKSTIVEYIMRLINNFAAAFLGEEKKYPDAEHLHFIEGVNGRLFFIIRNKIYRLTIDDWIVKLEYFKTRKKSANEYTYSGLTSIKTIEVEKDEISGFYIAKEYQPEPFEQENKNTINVKRIFENFFYTYVSNYSIYAYNTGDYTDELTDEKKEYDLRYKKDDDKKDKKNNPVPTIDDRSWIKGIFHKNDGYQTPIVLTPYREKGCIDINKENQLSRERLLSLVLMQESKFRTINGHLRIKSLRIDGSHEGNTVEDIRKKLKWYSITEDEKKIYYRVALKRWGQIMKVDFSDEKFKKRKYYQSAIDYLGYKTLKISSKYIQYNTFFKDLCVKKGDGTKEVGKLITKLANDKSHITAKIRQTLAYLLYDVVDKIGNYSIEDLIIEIRQEYIDRRKGKEKEKYIDYINISDILPPPFLDTTLILEDINTRKEVSFNTLSSGERQQAFSISSILYHLNNINSVHSDKNRERIGYNNIFVILEEIELYFHPELQKSYLLYLLDGIRQMHYQYINAIQICLVTHSPFILSDIPSSCILPLRKNEESTNFQLKSFAANIYEMFKNSFFMDNGTVGDYARIVVNKVIIALKLYQWAGKQQDRNRKYIIKDSSQDSFLETCLKTFPESFPLISNKKWMGDPVYWGYVLRRGIDCKYYFLFCDFQKYMTKEKIEKIISQVDEPFARQSLIEEFTRTFSKKDTETLINQEIEELQKKIEILKSKKNNVEA